MSLVEINRALEKLTAVHAAGGTVYTLLSSRALQEWPPDQEFKPTLIQFLPRMRRHTIAWWLDRITWRIGPSRADGWIGTFDVSHSNEGYISVFVGWFQDPEPTLGPVMSFGAAFLDHERWYAEFVRAAFETEVRQQRIDNLLNPEDPP